MNGEEDVLVKLDSVWFAYGRRWVVKDVSFAARAGELTAVVGPNGAGKSTILRIASGFLRPTRGSAFVLGYDPATLAAPRRGKIVTYMGAEAEPVFGFTVEETVLLGRFPHTGPLRKENPEDIAAARQAMGALDLEDLAGRPITDLSSGERQRVYLARALCQETRVLLLDEPTAHLDMAYEMRVMELLTGIARKRDAAVVVILHDLNLAARYASQLYFIRDGAVYCSGSPVETVTPETIRRVYSAESSVFFHPEGGWPQVVPLRPADDPPEDPGFPDR